MALPLLRNIPDPNRSTRTQSTLNQPRPQSTSLPSLAQPQPTIQTPTKTQPAQTPTRTQDNSLYQINLRTIAKLRLTEKISKLKPRR